jgi:hypothetical protein
MASSYSIFYGHLERLGFKDDFEFKCSLVRQFTDNRTASLKAMTPVEYDIMIRFLRGQTPAKSNPAPAPSAPTEGGIKQQKMNEMRKKIFSLLRSMGYISGYSDDDKKINQAVVYAMVERHGYLKPKRLNGYSFEELIKLVSQFESWQKNNNKAEAAKAVAALKKELGL